MNIKRNLLKSLVFSALLTPVVVSATMHEPMSPPMPMPPPMPPMPMMDGVVFEHSDFVFGFDAFSDSFYIHDAGMYQATLTDFEFPNEFDYIGFMVTQGATTRMGAIETPGNFTFNAEPGMYNAVFVGYVGDMVMPMSMDHHPGGSFSPVSSLGYYGVQVAMVPELETWAMMSFGLVGLGYWARRQNRQRTQATIQPLAA